MSNEITVYDNPGTLMTRATDVAGVCSEIVKRTAQQIQGRKYVKVEGWQSIAAAYGCVASSTHVEETENGVRAVGELRRISDGQIIATAEGFVGKDEATWYGGEVNKYGKTTTLPKRNDFAIRAMAQTRAISRVCRSAFAFVVVLIDGNLSTTPAEEMQAVVVEDDAPKRGRPAKNPSPQSAEAARPGDAPLASPSSAGLDLAKAGNLDDVLPDPEHSPELRAALDAFYDAADGDALRTAGDLGKKIASEDEKKLARRIYSECMERFAV